jgi:hypothetical protein
VRARNSIGNPQQCRAFADTHRHRSGDRVIVDANAPESSATPTGFTPGSLDVRCGCSATTTARPSAYSRSTSMVSNGLVSVLPPASGGAGGLAVDRGTHDPDPITNADDLGRTLG